ncbi:MAG: thiamine-phosphate diphosphorylase [Deltaproteobacteria bacterium GWC2_42_11]|nr:MAG: thiamine-phosphate diphosphorylase [Deltaproteobacteria bacterium GWC2_42_11]HBO83419.1 thiamine phosphate synthase [Deltaproteobacteria bacterium]
MIAFMPFKKISGFYPIIDTSLIAVSGVDNAARAVVEGGAEIIQLRCKEISAREFIKIAMAIKLAACKNNVLLIINDRVDIAILAGADGVHLGQDDLPIEDARRILGEGKIIGVSTHNMDEAVIAAQKGADYISFGPIFSTITKKDAQEPKGVEKLMEVKGRVKIPVVAIGGITLENAAEVYRAGADSTAVISGLLKSSDIKGRVRRFITIYEKCTNNSRL